jgi:cytochrome c oxidase cbb3-type subunit II
MPTYKMSDRTDMLQVKDREGIIWCHYHQPPVGDGQARVRGPVIDYIGPKYLQRWLDLGLVEELGAERQPQCRPLPQQPPAPPSARYRMTGKAAAIYVADAAGRQYLHFHDPVVAESTEGARGPEIDWLSAAEAQLFLMLGFVEKVGAPTPAPAAEPVEMGTAAVGGNVDECLADLDRLNVPPDSGAPTCRAALRGAGLSYSNDLIAVVVRLRRSRAELAEATAT